MFYNPAKFQLKRLKTERAVLYWRDLTSCQPEVVEFKHTEFFTSHGDYLLNIKLKVPSVGFSAAGLDRAKLGVYRFQSFLFIVVIVISILLKPTFLQISTYSQSLVKIL